MIRVLFFVLLVGGLTLSATAQVSAGRYLLGFSASADYTTSGSDFGGDTWGVRVSPNVLYLLSNQVALGGRLGLNLTEFSRLNPITGKIEDEVTLFYSVSTTARVYLSDAGTGGFFIDASGGVRGRTTEDSDLDFLYNAGVGYSFFFSKGLALEPRLRIVGSTGDFSSTSFGLSVGLQGFVDRLLPRKPQAESKG